MIGPEASDASHKRTMSKLKSPRCASLIPELSLTGAKLTYKTGIGAAVNVTVSAFLFLSAVGARIVRSARTI